MDFKFMLISEVISINHLHDLPTLSDANTNTNAIILLILVMIELEFNRNLDVILDDMG